MANKCVITFGIDLRPIVGWHKSFVGRIHFPFSQQYVSCAAVVAAGISLDIKAKEEQADSPLEYSFATAFRNANRAWCQEIFAPLSFSPWERIWGRCSFRRCRMFDRWIRRSQAVFRQPERHRGRTKPPGLALEILEERLVPAVFTVSTPT